ncbi:MAG: hypothetical protein H7070_00720, partial [Saprospiraceae bacterium]|nr:hypothetical protein [Pyrinomonadaceae bacterium]
AESIGITFFNNSDPSFGGMRVSSRNGEPSIISPTAAIVIESDAADVGDGRVSADATGVVRTRV